MEKCSPMFAYVRLCSLNRKKIVEGAARGHRGREGREKEECPSSVAASHRVNPSAVAPLRRVDRVQNQVGRCARRLRIAKCTKR